MDTDTYRTPEKGSTWLEVPQCWALLRQSAVGRLAVLHDGRPDIFPVNYVVDHGTVVLRTGSGALFTSASESPVALEADGYELHDATAWSVVVKGVAHEVYEVDDAVDAMRLPLVPWHDVPKPRILRIHPDSVTGRRIAVRGGHREPGSSTAARV
ncbi:pyridoxamine 5'-phosphate oxidase family protein [Pedococcus sp. 5OH_020]|uniref:pyridoxamine 5'-phosphate oxidase family protein n=1 Tax=Pedococcus sp. 5OH_020 TaxID=2989814 RepID=UPI0022E9A38B|nr:pyridoxamine 5'-phosphate oxidase family protein [Pedococcus sp. 5OH_020]